MVYQDPQPLYPEINACYQQYLPGSDQDIAKLKRGSAGFFKAVSHRLKKMLGPSGRLLDIGCGYGFFLKQMRDLGWSVVGCEISKAALDYAQSQLGLEVMEGPFEQLSFKAEEFDLVSAFYVIEHIARPVCFLRKVYSILKQGGLIWVRFPHTTPIVRWGKLLFDLDLSHAPWHLLDFSPQTIRLALQLAGFVQIKVGVLGIRPLALVPGLSKDAIGYKPSQQHRPPSDED
jgi:SAM-dependent methyltransferase